MKTWFLLKGKTHTELEISRVSAQFLPKESLNPSPSATLKLRVPLRPVFWPKMTFCLPSSCSVLSENSAKYSCDGQLLARTYFGFLLLGAYSAYSELLSGQGLVRSAFWAVEWTVVCFLICSPIFLLLCTCPAWSSNWHISSFLNIICHLSLSICSVFWSLI